MDRRARTAASYLRAIEHRLGSDQTELDHLETINQAAQVLENRVRWRWLAKMGVLVRPVEGQDYVNLPLNVRSVSRVVREGYIDDTNGGATLEEMERLRAYGGNAVGFRWALAREVWDEDEKSYRPRLELYPTPSASPDPMTVLYHGQIPRVFKGGALVQIPDWLQGVFEELSCNLAQAREEPELYPRAKAIDAVFDSSEFYDARVRDGETDRFLGTWTGGAAQREVSNLAYGYWACWSNWVEATP